MKEVFVFLRSQLERCVNDIYSVDLIYAFHVVLVDVSLLFVRHVLVEIPWW
jgi:hypothetical protein